MLVQQAITEFLTNSEIEDTDLPHFPSYFDLYKKCKIDLQDFYESCVLLSYKTSNSQTEIEKMPFWKFNNLMVGLDKILKHENGDNKQSKNDDEEENPYMKQARQAFNSAKAQMPKIPKLPSVKIK